MEMKCILVLVLVAAACLIGIKGQACDDRSSPELLPYPRVIHGMRHGPAVNPSKSRSNFLKSVGNCSPSLVDDMIKFFTSFGADVERVRRDALREYQEEDFTLTPYDELSQPVPLRIYSSIFYDYAKFVNSRWYWGEWVFIANKDMEGTRGSLKSGNILFYGSGRIMLHGREFCIQTNAKYPITDYKHFIQNIYTFADDLYNDSLGHGTLIGTAQGKNTTTSTSYLITFPAW